MCFNLNITFKCKDTYVCCYRCFSLVLTANHILPYWYALYLYLCQSSNSIAVLVSIYLFEWNNESIVLNESSSSQQKGSRHLWIFFSELCVIATSVSIEFLAHTCSQNTIDSVSNSLSKNKHRSICFILLQEAKGLIDGLAENVRKRHFGAVIPGQNFMLALQWVITKC